MIQAFKTRPIMKTLDKGFFLHFPFSIQEFTARKLDESMRFIITLRQKNSFDISMFLNNLMKLPLNLHGN